GIEVNRRVERVPRRGGHRVRLEMQLARVARAPAVAVFLAEEPKRSGTRDPEQLFHPLRHIERFAGAELLHAERPLPHRAVDDLLPLGGRPELETGTPDLVRLALG